MTKVICWKIDCKHYLFCPEDSKPDQHQCAAEKINLVISPGDHRQRFCFTYEKIGEKQT